MQQQDQSTAHRIFTAVLFTVLLAAGCDRGGHPSRIGKPAPPFSVSDATQTADLSQFRGHVVILNLWATWCAPCVEELPSLLQLHDQMPQLTIIAISQDEDPGTYRRFLTQHHVNFLTVRDPSARVNHLYGTVQIPESYVIDKHGILRRKFVSAQNWTSPEITSYLATLERN